MVAVSFDSAFWLPEKRTPEEWCEAYGLRVLDPDGWRAPGDPGWFEPITLVEFHERALVSTTDGLVSGAFERIEADLRAVTS